MLEKNKKILIIISIIIIVALLIIGGIALVKNKTSEKNTSQLKEADLINVLEIEDINKTQYKMEKTKESVSSKYSGDTKYILDATVKMEDTTGKMIYLRGTDNVNIFKTEYELDKYKDTNMQIRNIIDTFEEKSKSYIGINEDSERSEITLGESKAEFTLPVEESIYNEGRTYSITYKSDEKEYNINFYKQDDKIICELAKII